MQDTAVLTVRCPGCQARVRWEAASAFRPFCSARCKLTDLGQWADEGYRLPAIPAEGVEGDALMFSQAFASAAPLAK